ncbi:activator-dependent family glycosyltransferase [Streptomyces sp. NPDC056568]|uniref:activator-dependent family glycosyltransferase n=1 Tax=Streptomyces sp. NPDC056568 TaxID=3345866 RepID=UPI0036A25414
MRVLVTSIPHHTHYYHLVPLIWALRASGHEVVAAGQPSLVDAITASGIPAFPLAEEESLAQIFEEVEGDLQPYQHGIDEFDFLGTLKDELDWEKLLAQQVILSGLWLEPLNGATTLDSIVGFARAWKPDLVLWEPFTYAGPVAARACGAAHARVLWGPDTIGLLRTKFLEAQALQPEEHRDDPVAEWMTWALARYGCDFREEDVLGHWSVDPMAEGVSLGLDLPTVPMRYTPYNGSAVIPEWLTEEPKRPRVCLTLGVSSREHSEDEVPVQRFLEALADLDIELVATLDDAQRDLLPRIPDNTRIVDFVPMDALLPTCSAIINHSGSGTCNTAALHGVPQIILGGILDAAVRQHMFAQSSAALTFAPEEVTGEALRSALVRLLEEPRFRDGARRLKERMRAMPSPAGIVPTLERLTAEHRRAG